MEILGIILLLATIALLLWVGLKRPHSLSLKPGGIRLAKPTEQLVVIATFLSSDHVRNRNIAQELRHGLEKAIRDLDLKNVRVEVEHTRLLSDDVENARRIGRKYNATVIVWGTDTGERLTLNMLNPLTTTDEQENDPLLKNLAKYRVDDNTFIIVPPSHNRFSTRHFQENLEFISYLTLGHIYDVENHYPEAIQVLAKAVASINPAVPPLEGLAQTYHRLGWIYHVPLDNAPISLRYYNKAIEQDPTFVDAYNNRGVLRLFSNDPVGALADFDQALKLNPRLIGALMSRGTLYNQLGKLELAVADYDRFLELAGDSVFNIAAYFGRGSARAKLAEFDAAIDDFCRALAMEPDDNIKAAILYSIANTLKNKAMQADEKGDVHAAREDYEKAVKDYTDAIPLFASDEDKANAWLEIGVIQGTLDNYHDAIKALDKAIKLFQDPKKKSEAENYRMGVTQRLDRVKNS